MSLFSHATEPSALSDHATIAPYRGSAVGRTERPLSLALQGGGSFGAFTWGVLDRILNEGVPLDAVSGTSAGALNAVLLASGLAEGGPEQAKRKLARFWKRASETTPRLP